MSRTRAFISPTSLVLNNMSIVYPVVTLLANGAKGILTYVFPLHNRYVSLVSLSVIHPLDE